MLEYLRLTKGLADFGELIAITPTSYTKISKSIKAHPTKDHYASLYKYNDEHFTEFQKNPTVKGITNVVTHRLLWDFDDGQKIENAQQDTKELCSRLIEDGVPENKIRIFFSGNKGFHVEVITDQNLTRQEFVNITFNLAEGLISFDTTINNESRVIRLPYTVNEKSGLYKIPLTLEQLNTYSVEDIRINATDISNLKPIEYLKEDNWQIPMPSIIGELKTKTFKTIEAPREIEQINGFNLNDLERAKCPRWMSMERYALQEGFFYGSQSIGRGERNSAFMILAATYRNQGFSEDHALGLLMATSEKQAKRTGEDPYTEYEMKSQVINTVFSPSWKGGIYGKDEALLVETRRRFNITESDVALDLVKIDDVGIDFKEFARNIDQNTVKTGLKSLDDSVLITSGMMVSLLAAPGAGKTSFANKFVEHLSKQGEKTIYFSLDMYKNLMFTRLLQKYSGYNMQRILNLYKEEQPDEKLMNAYSQVLLNYSNTYFNFRSGPTVEEIDEEIFKYKESSGHKPKLVVIDYLEKIRGPFSDSTANSGYVASRLSDIAKKHDLVVLLLVQPQKAAGDPREELITYRKIKGASVIEQDSRVIMTLSRPGYNPANMENDLYASIAVVKNNMGNLCKLDYRWDGVTGELYELQDGDAANLRKLREEITKAKVADQRGYGDI